MIIKKEQWFPFKLNAKFIVCCPFHKEITPSCIVNPNKGTFQCIGCGVEGYIGDDYSLFTEDKE